MSKGWIAPVVLGLLVASFTIAPGLIAPYAYGFDFHMFYAAGLLTAGDLYDLDAQRSIEEDIWRQHRRDQIHELNFSPYFRPAYYRLVLIPLAWLPYWTAFAVWTTLQSAAFLAAVFLLGKRFGFEDSYWLLLIICPFVWRGLVWGQDVCAVLFLIALSLELLARGRDGLAGGALALALVKWNVLVLVPFALLFSKRRRLFASFAAVASAEVAISLAIMGRKGIADFFAALQDPYADIMRLGMPSLRGLLLNFEAPDAVIAPLLLVLSGITVFASRRLRTDHAIALAVTGSVALGLHTMSYDFLLLFVPLFVLRPFDTSLFASASLLFGFSPLAMLRIDTPSRPFDLHGVAGVLVAAVMFVTAMHRRRPATSARRTSESAG